MTNKNGDLAWQAEYSPFGELFSNEISQVVNNLRFPGQYFDAESGLHQNWFRDYSPTLGRYIQADPIDTLNVGGLPHRMSRAGVRLPGAYWYAAANPVMSADPMGLKECGPAPTSSQFSKCESYCLAAREWADCSLRNTLNGVTMIGGALAVVGGLGASLVTTPVGGVCVGVGLGAATAGLHYAYEKYAEAIIDASFNQCMAGCATDQCRLPNHGCVLGVAL